MEKILIRNGTLYDPAAHQFYRKDLAVAGKVIADAEHFVPDWVIDADGCIVTPGLIDFHLHCNWLGSDGASDADSFCLPNGVTTCVDGGTAGSAGFEGFYSSCIARARTRVLSLLHVAPEGLTTGRHPENQTPADWDRDKIRDLLERFPEIVGLKIRMGRSICEPYGLTDEHLKEGIALAESLGARAVVHVNDPNVGTDRIAAMLRPGDVFCHMYAGKNENILDGTGHVKRDVLSARQRGVIFDACNGRGNFLFKVAEAAMADGFCPDIISSDNSPMGCYRQPLVSLPRLLSKYLALGMSLEDVLDCATIAPARWLDREDLAALAPDTCADIAIFRLKDKTVIHRDVAGEQREGAKVLVPQLTMKDGVIAYSQSDFL